MDKERRASKGACRWSVKDRRPRRIILTATSLLSEGDSHYCMLRQTGQSLLAIRGDPSELGRLTTVSVHTKVALG